MNQELMDMAKQAGFFVKDNEAYSPSVQEDHELTPFLEAFAALVAATEREACAKECEEWGGFKDGYSCATIIRARGKTK
jgi:hypothetical protein